MKSNDIDMEITGNSKEEILVKEKEKVDKEKIPKIKNIEELTKYIPELKHIKALDYFTEQFYHGYSKKSDKPFDIWKINTFTLQEKIGFYTGFGIFFIPVLIYFLSINILFFFIYIIAVCLQYFNPLVKKILESKNNKSFEEFKKKMDQITKTNVYFINGKKKDKPIEDMEFILKNCIDISGEINMTIPPEFCWVKKFNKTNKISNIQQKELNPLIRISICPIQLFTVDKSTERKAEVYIKYYTYLFKKPNILYNEIFFRQFNYFY